MATINTIKNPVEIRTTLKANGTKVEHIVIDGVTCGILGFSSETDKANAIKVLNDAYIASGGDIMEMICNLSSIASIDEHGIEPDEVVSVNGTDIIIDYAKAKAYDMDGNELANCDDLPKLPFEATKAVLIERLK